MRSTTTSHRPMFRLTTWTALALLLLMAHVATASTSEDPPINYPTTPAHDAIAKLQAGIDAGKTSLPFNDKHGYLDAVLKYLKIPVSSQSLVFSKTSFQRDLIAPWKPRALYFNDDVYIGWVQGGDVLEVASVDPNLGPVFYTLGQQPAAKPKFVRQTDACLQCHESNNTQNVPGLMVRSVFPDAAGMPIYSAGTFRTTDASVWTERWGGWYVTGSHGSQRHMGNLVVRKGDDADSIDREPGANLTDLSTKLDVTPYAAKTSDVVALMVLVHQTNVHNLLTRCNYETRIAERDQKAINEALGEKPDYVSEGTRHRIQSACEPLLKGMLFCDEVPLTDQVVGSSDFAAQFAAAGPRDPAGRSLRDFDLSRRLFKYPCSFLIYTDSFRALPASAKAYFFRRLFDVLNGKETGKEFERLSPGDRKAIREILLATMADLPDYWRK